MVNYNLTGTRNAQALTKFTHAVPRRCAAAVSAGGDDACREHLLEQVRLGEASNRELVRQSLYRLELIDPNNPELIAARMRYLLRQGDAAGAQKELERLTKLAPDSPELKASRNEMKSNTGEGRQALQQARLLGVAGKVDEAIAAYEKLYGGVPDDVDVAIEYWTLVARLPSRHSEGVSQLKN